MYSGIDSAVIEVQVIEQGTVHVLFPQIGGLQESVARKINLLIDVMVKSMMSIQGLGYEKIQQMKGTYQVTLNEKGLLSLRFENFTYVEHAAHPTTLVRSLTVDLHTGQEYQLYEFFRNMSGHAIQITNYILREMKRLEIPLAVDLRLIPDNHVYYLTPDSLVIYFQEGEIAARVYGVLEFPLRYSFFISMLESDSPLKRLI